MCFDPSETHPDLLLDSSCLTVTKTVAGMYRSARTVQAILPDQWSYFEVLFRIQSKSGGVCVGLSTHDTSLKNLIGSCEGSLGLYSTGDVISNGKWKKYCKPFVQGSVVGVLCRLTSQDGE